MDWQRELGMVDVKQQLLTSVLLMRRSYTHRLFTGLRGGGKTTELRRLQRELEQRPYGDRYFVSLLDADDALDLDDADPTDLVLAIVRQLVDDLRTADVLVEPGGRMRAFLSAVRDALAAVPDTGVDLQVGDPAGIAQLSTTLKRQPSVRREVRRLLEGSLPTLYDALNEEVLPRVKGELKDRGYAGLLVVVDQLDRMPAAEDRHQRVFWEGRGKLTALDCHVVYTAPIDYAYSRAAPALENEYGELLGLPLLPVSAEDTAVRDRALELTRAIALRRLQDCGTQEDELFDGPEALEALSRVCGGHVRTLFHLVRTAIETSDLRAPLTAGHVDRVVGRLAAKYLDPLEGPERRVVEIVHRTNARPEDEALLPHFYELLRDQYVFSYAVADRRWYDWNPLLGRSALGST